LLDPDAVACRDALAGRRDCAAYGPAASLTFPDAKSDTVADAKSDTKSDTKSDAKSDTVADAKSDGQLHSCTNVQPGADAPANRHACADLCANIRSYRKPWADLRAAYGGAVDTYTNAGCHFGFLVADSAYPGDSDADARS
jgi:hypothetical protein